MIETARLLLRPAAQDDVPEIVRYFRDNQAHLQPFYPYWPPDYLTEGVWRDRVERSRQELEADQAERLFLFKRSEPERLIGTVTLSQINRGPSQSAILGYGLAESEQGHGYMTEAVEAVVRHGFDELHLHRIAAGYMPHNRGSGAVLRKLGFAVEGYSRDFLLMNGRWEDHIQTALLNAAWRER